MSNATHFIEVVKYPDGEIKYMSPRPMNLIKWAFNLSKKFGIETICIFKISLKK